jgi:hypothetical protein
MQVQANFAPLFRAGLRKDFRDEYDRYEPEYPMYLRTGSISTPEFNAALITGLNRLLEMEDGEPVTYQSPVMGPRVIAIDREFGAGVSISKKTIEDDQYGKMRSAAKWLAHACRMTYEYRAASFLDDAFTGSLFKGYDGLAWCSASHTFINATGTWSNSLAPALPVSVAGVTAMEDAFQTLKDHNGDPIRSMFDTIIIGNNAGDWNRALQIFGSDKEPFTAENQDNALKKRHGSPKIVVSRFKSSLRSWFGVDSKLSDAHFLVRRPVQVEDEMDFGTGAMLTKATTRIMIFGVDPRGWVGSNAT